MIDSAQQRQDETRPLFPFDNSYARLPAPFQLPQTPTPVASPKLIAFNTALATELGLDADALDGELGAEIFSGNRIPPGAEPLAMAYSGHQFGHFNPHLGDGRAILLGEVVDRHGRRRDIQLKGPGQTPFSRRGDGRAALGPVLREYLVSEAMFALGVPTTRALAAVSTGQPVYRETTLPGAIVTRVAASHIRVGTFQYFASRKDLDNLKTLADFVITRHYPQLASLQSPYAALLEAITDAQAKLVAHWMSIGFIHGVMNTDNVSVSGETIDYGPCAFMDTYDPATVYSAIDQNGRYAFANQPGILVWNMARLAEALLPLLDDDLDKGVDLANEILSAVAPRYQAHWLARMTAKLGLSRVVDGDLALVQDFLNLLHEGQLDFTNSFRAFAPLIEDKPQFFVDFDTAAGSAWLARWRGRLGAEGTSAIEQAALARSSNPVVIPRNHRIQEVIEAAMERDDFAPFETLMTVLSKPYSETTENLPFTRPPQPEERVLRTFCGT